MESGAKLPEADDAAVERPTSNACAFLAPYHPARDDWYGVAPLRKRAKAERVIEVLIGRREEIILAHRAAVDQIDDRWWRNAVLEAENLRLSGRCKGAWIQLKHKQKTEHLVEPKL